jgi:hypothetical protein
MRAIWVVLVGLGVGACTPRPTRPVRELPSEASARLERPAMTWSTVEKQPVGDTNAPLRAAFEAALTEEARANIRYESRLDVVAEVVGETYRFTGQFPVAALTQWLSWRAGVLGEGRLTWVVSGVGNEEGFDEALVKWARKVRASPSDPLAYGVVRFEGGGETVQALVAASDLVELEPLPKTIDPGATFEVKGRLRGRAASATLFVDEDDARVREVPVRLTEGMRFSVPVVAASTAGRRFIELSVEPVSEVPGVRAWRRTAFMVPLYVGTPEPKDPDVSIKAPAPNPADPATWPAEITARYNQRRLELKLAPLEQSNGVEALAREYATQLVKSPETPPDPELYARLEQAGVLAYDGSQHRARSEFIDELVRRNLMRPGFRADLLAPGRVVFGVGLAAAGQGDWEAASVMARPVPVLDAKVENEKLVAALQAARVERGKGALQTLPVLSSALDRLAATACETGEPLTTLASVTQALEGAGWGGTVKGSTMVSTWLQAERAAEAFPKVAESSATHLALSSCQFKAGSSKGRELVLVLEGTLAERKRSK